MYTAKTVDSFIWPIFTLKFSYSYMSYQKHRNTNICQMFKNVSKVWMFLKMLDISRHLYHLYPYLFSKNNSKSVKIN